MSGGQKSKCDDSPNEANLFAAGGRGAVGAKNVRRPEAALIESDGGGKSETVENSRSKGGGGRL